MHVVITGANRGLGLEMVRQLSERHRVHALARDPGAADALGALAGGSVQVTACDVTDDGSVAAAAAECGLSHVDVLINNAGVAGRRDDFEHLDLDDLQRTFAVNAVAPLRVTRAFLPLLRTADAPRVVHISSKMGSMDDNASGGAWGYRMSKTALNMAAVNLHREFAPGLSSVALHPGWVRTDMGGAAAPLAIPDAVRRLLRTIEGLGSAHSGGFFDLDGARIAW